jgi:hypothetical protein
VGCRDADDRRGPEAASLSGTGDTRPTCAAGVTRHARGGDPAKRAWSGGGRAGLGVAVLAGTMNRAITWLASVAALAGCAAHPGAGKPGDGTPTNPFTCDSSAAPAPLPLRRLSETQLRNSIADVIQALAPADATAINQEIAGAFAALPPDSRSGPDERFGGLRRLDQTLYGETAEAAYAIGEALGAAIVKPKAGKRTRLTAAAGACATDTDTTNDAACLDAFVRKFGAVLLRRPLTADDVAFYTGVAGTTREPEDYGDVLAVMVSSPRFLYFVEEGQADSAANPRPLTAHELAARLSYHFWQTLPDAELRAVADDGSLLTDAVYQHQVERLSTDARAASAIGELFGDWLEPTFLGALDANVGSADFDAFRGSFLPTAALRDHMVAELPRMARYYTLDTPGTFTDFFRSNRSFAETDDVAALYGVAPWHGGEPPVFADAGREGVLARAALTATGFVTTRPIIKGVFARKAILCDVIGEPPNDVMDVVATLPTMGVTSRAHAEAISEARADCAGCHKTLINPLGFPTESYDGLGRRRTTEAVYAPTGALLQQAAIDTSSAPHVLADGSPADDAATVANVAELDAQLLASGKPQACFARRYFRFAFARLEDQTGHTDDCVLAGLNQDLVDGKPLSEVVRSIALRPEFRTRPIL